MRRFFLLTILFLSATALSFGGIFLVRHFSDTTHDKNAVPEPRAYDRPAPSQNLPTAPPSPTPPSSTPEALPADTNLAVPFTSQAPKLNWDATHEEFCEEASMLMAASYLSGVQTLSPDEADAKMFAIKDFEEQRLGYFESTTAAETAMILREYFHIENVQLLENPDATSIKKALAQGKVVLVPAAGRQLLNPYFTPPGPLYHMLLIKGYTKDGRFITNDPGTRRGADFLYDSDTLLNAVHDWNGGDVDHGNKVVIIVG